MTKLTDEEIDDFFMNSPLFEEDRKKEKEEIERLEKMLIGNVNCPIVCKRCKTKNIELRSLQIRRTDEGPTLVYYCINCNKIAGFPGKENEDFVEDWIY
ncbi:hypothetical protein BCR36DRAFT_150106 [Piromyces finnis]|uniref:TFIIS-type domain-containing protein n=1 Tax=Piromyces finnis TaxID=1754191 RepID=A0A1Y1UXA5_9FUNG|nr:hypothetical protein BCR36DRAFT_150106 [Piromyces finnis]|eukprot:ORX42854.1 hypothetical protein BCR36DRAFT_150106 [Piromyces finnis]